MILTTKGGRELRWRYYNTRIAEEGKSSYVLGHAQDVTELKEAQEWLKGLSLTDDLTLCRLIGRGVRRLLRAPLFLRGLFGPQRR